MMKMPSNLLVSVSLIFFLSACNLPNTATNAGTQENIVATSVILTLSALTQSVPQQTPLASPTQASPTVTPPLILSPSLTPTITLNTAPTLTLEPSITPVPKPGTISGAISGYPYGSLPRLAIVAFGQEPPYNYSYWITAAGDNYYSMTSQYMLPGKYQVVAYDSSSRAGGCTKIVNVISDQTVTCDITNWGGSYPSKPSGVPNP